MKWYEELPLDCPPDEAYSPEGYYFRLGSSHLMTVIFGHIDRKDGLIQQTGKDTHHFSWWRSTEFDLSMINTLDQ